MKQLIILALILLAVNANAAILCQSPNGGVPYAPTTLAAAAVSPSCKNTSVVVTTPHVVTTAIAWPADRGLGFAPGGYITFTGAGALTGLKEAKPEWFGIVDGVADDIQINYAIASLSTNGGKVIFSPQTYGINSSIVVGNGSAAGASTRNNVHLIGAGIGSAAEILVGDNTGTVFRWDNLSAGTMFDLRGPIVGVKMSDMAWNCNDVATTGLDLKQPMFSEFHNVVVKSHVSAAPYTDFAIRLTSYQNGESATPPYSRGAISNTFDKVIVRDPGANSNGITIGSGTRDVGAAWDVLQNEFRDCTFTANSSNIANNTTALELRFTDNISFYQCIVVQFAPANGTALRVSPPTGTNPTNSAFPAEVTFFSTAIIGGVESTPSWVPPAGLGFYPWPIADGEGTPSTPYFFGVTSHGRNFGMSYSGAILNDHGATNISIAAATPTVVSFPYTNSDHEGMSYDIGGGVYGIKPGFTGMYQIGCHIQWGTSNVGDRTTIIYRRDTLNNVDVELSRVTQRNTVTGGVIQGLSVLDEMIHVGDYYFVRVYQDTAGALDLVRTNDTNVRAPKFWITRVR